MLAHVFQIYTIGHTGKLYYVCRYASTAAAVVLTLLQHPAADGSKAPTRKLPLSARHQDARHHWGHLGTLLQYADSRSHSHSQ